MQVWHDINNLQMKTSIRKVILFSLLYKTRVTKIGNTIICE